MPISFKLEHVIEEVISEHPRGQKRVLKRLADVKLPAAEARNAWPRILEHKWYMSERLGRDVGLRVAAIDYFENIQPLKASSPMRIMRGALPAPLPFMRPLNG